MKVLKVEHYIIQEMISEGTFGQVMMATNTYTNVTVAAKLEPKDVAFPQLKDEYEMYELLGSETPGFIKIYHYGPCNRLYNALIMELLGPDLDDLFVGCRMQFSHKTVLMIARQTIELMRYVHGKDIIYRDVKPENFCIGHRYQSKEKIIHIIDFGLAKLEQEMMLPDNDDNIIYGYLVGTARYMSVNAHIGMVQSKRDDLESLGYMYIYFLLGKLPWMGLSGAERLVDHYKDIGEIKRTTPPEQLVESYPEMVEYMNYVKKLKFREEPDYDYVLGLMKKAFEEKQYEYDCIFDWNDMMNKKLLGDAIELDPDD